MKKTIVVLLMSIAFVGCATIFSKTSEEIRLESEPSGAKVYLDGNYLGTTPLVQKVDRETFGTRTLRFTKEGYATKNVHLEKTLNKVSLWNFGFLFTTFGSTSWGIDAISGAMVQYSPNSYIMELEKKEETEEEETTELSTGELRFVVENYENLRRDLARKEGEYLRQYHQLTPMADAPFEKFMKALNLEKHHEIQQSTNGLELYRSLKKIVRS